MEEQPYTVKMWRGQLEIILSALHESRMRCEEPDCLQCCFYGEIEGRLERALHETGAKD